MDTRIARASLTHVVVPYKEGRGANRGQGPPQRESLLLTLEDAHGRIGLGECSPPYFGPGSTADIQSDWSALTGSVIPSLLDQQPGSLDSPTVPAGWAQLPLAARAAVDGALLDLIAQQEHCGLAQLLGASRERIEAGVEASVWLDTHPTIVDLLRAMEPHRQEGIRAFVIAIEPGRDLAFVEAACSHCAECLIAVDAKARYSPSDAELFRRLDALDPLWIADPWDSADLDGLAQLQRELVTPICLDATDPEVIRRKACRLARIELQRLGGLTAARHLHNLAAEHQIGCQVATGPELGVGLAQSIAFATLPNCKDPSGLAPSSRWFVEDLLRPSIDLDDQSPGFFRIPTRAGLGHLLDLPCVHQHQVRTESWGRTG